MTREPVIVPKASAFTMTASRSGTNYRIAVAEPIGPAPSGGYPIVYMLDAGGSFSTMVEAIRARCRRPDATGVGSAIVVGIGMDGGGRRTYDYTPGPSVTPGDHSIPGGGQDTGGAEAFRWFIEQELIPDVEQSVIEPDLHARVDPRRRVLFGHSLAGFFALWTLTQGSRAFDTIVAASPSIWWNPPLLLDSLAIPLTPALSPQAGRGRGEAWRPRVMLTVGEHEQRRAPWQPTDAWTDDALRRRTERRMVDAAREMAGALGRAGAIVDFHEFAGEDHASVVILSIARALRFALDTTRNPES